MKPEFWPAAFGLGALVVVYSIMAFGPRALGVLTGKSGLSETINVTNLVIQFVVLVVALFSIAIAVTTLKDAQASGEAQQTALTKVHTGLDSVLGELRVERELMERQREALDKTYEASTKHLLLVQKSYDEEKARLARKPVIHIGLRNVADAKLNEAQPLPVRPNGWARLNVVLRNDGDIEFTGGVGIYTADVPGVRVERRDIHIPRQTPQRLELAVGRIHPFQMVSLSERVELDIFVPAEATGPFTLTILIIGDKVRETRTVTLQPTRAGE